MAKLLQHVRVSVLAFCWWFSKALLLPGPGEAGFLFVTGYSVPKGDAVYMASTSIEHSWRF